MKNLKRFLNAFFLLVFIASAMPAWSFAASNNTLSCAGYTVNIKDNAPGLVMVPGGLSLTDPQIVAMDSKNSCAVVVWNTNRLATSQVVFAKKGQNRNFEILDKSEKEFWGYPNGSKQNADPQVHHVMIINGLEKGAKYYLRAISRSTTSSLPFSSKEFEFVFDDARVAEVQTDRSDNSTQGGDNDAASANQTRSANVAQQPDAYYHNASWQKQKAAQINRRIAPAHSGGKMSLYDYDKEVKLEVISDNKQSDEQQDESMQSQNEQTEDSKQDEYDGKLVEVIGAANAGDNLKPVWQSLWDKIKGYFKSLFGSDSSDVDGNADGVDKKDKSSQEDNEEKVEETQAQDKSSDKEDALAVANIQIKSINKDGSEQVLSKIAKDSSEKIEKGMDTMAQSSVALAGSAKKIFEKMGILVLVLPVLVLIGFLYFVQKFLLKNYQFLEGKVLYYWMGAFLGFAILFAIVGMIPMALSFLALFLLTLAWYLFNIAIADMEELDVSSIKKIELNGKENS